MKLLKALNRDILFKIELKLIDGCMEFCLVNANDGDEIYILLNEEDIEE